MTYNEYITSIQTIVGEYMPNETILTVEQADKLAARLLEQQELINPQIPKKGHHQTVLVYRDQNNWIPVTTHWQTNAEGLINYVRIHTNRYIREYGEESFSA
jgi:ABC-type Fe3+-hydroxamate transport system substrate-binding protein